MKKLFIAIFFLALGVVLGWRFDAIYQARQEAKAVAFIKESFNIFDEGNTEEQIARYHAPSYVQHSDGKVLGYQDLIKHVDYVKSILASPLEIIYDDIVVQGNKVCTVHRARAAKKDGQKVEIKVIAVHYLDNGKIVKTDELTKVIFGSDADKDMGSHH